MTSSQQKFKRKNNVKRTTYANPAGWEEPNRRARQLGGAGRFRWGARRRIGEVGHVTQGAGGGTLCLAGHLPDIQAGGADNLTNVFGAPGGGASGRGLKIREPRPSAQLAFRLGVAEVG